MPLSISLTLDKVRLTGELSDTQTAQALAGRMPLELSMSRWGEEYYGSIGAPLNVLSGPTQEVMSVGDLAYWEPGMAFCIFFGPTPASRGQAPVAAGPVHLIGSVSGDWQAVKALGQAVTAVLERA
jgi:hypothetical protein